MNEVPNAAKNWKYSIIINATTWFVWLRDVSDWEIFHQIEIHSNIFKLQFKVLNHFIFKIQFKINPKFIQTLVLIS